MKKIVLFIMLTVMLGSLMLIGCDSMTEENVQTAQSTQTTQNDNENSTNNSNNSENKSEDGVNKVFLDEFVELINSSEYLKAVELYNEKFVGNYELECSAHEKILEICVNTNAQVLSGECNEKQAKIRLGVIDKVVVGAGLSLDGYSDAVDNVQVSLASRSAYMSACELEQLGIYVDAVNEYRKVIENDSNYKLALDGADRCIEFYKTKLFNDSQEFVNKNDYIGAITLLKVASANFPDDAEIVSKIDIYEKAYINFVIIDADKAFETPEIDYVKSIEIINKALQYYPNNEVLNGKKQYYAEYYPVRLTDMIEYESDCQIYDTFTDSYGEKHENAICKLFYENYGCVIYVLDGKYNKLTFTVFGNGNEYASEDLDFSIRDYSSENFDTSYYLYKGEETSGTAKAYTVEVDVTGVQLVRIWVGSSVCIGDAMLQKTVK